MKNSIIAVIILSIIFVISIIVFFSVTATRCDTIWRISPRILEVCDTINALKDEPTNTVTYENYTNLAPKVIILSYYNRDKLIEYGKKWKSVNPNYTIDLYDDNDCYNYLLNNFSEYHANVFKNIKHGPIKCDYFRIHRMLEGGVYTDIDQPPFNVDPWINEFVIPIRSYESGKNINKTLAVEPSFIISPANHPFIKQCIATYEKIVKKVKYRYYKWSIASIMNILNYKNNKKIPHVMYYVIPKFLGIIPKFNNAYIVDVNSGSKISNVKLTNYNYKTHSF